MINSVECNTQACILTPTEVLAKQHFNTISKFLSSTGITPILLTGKNKGKPRTEILQLIKNGYANIIIGTPALFQADVRYKNLNLCVIDEQYRFGVEQRLLMQGKGNHLHT